MFPLSSWVTAVMPALARKISSLSSVWVRIFQPCGSFTSEPRDASLSIVKPEPVRIGDHDPGSALWIIEQIDRRRRCRSPTPTTGADANTVAETVTTPIEQQINGVKGMILLQIPTVRATASRRSLRPSTWAIRKTLGAVDIQNRVVTAQAALPPEVKQFGVTIKKTSTDMVCVVNLVSPDGRYDSTYLDNYAQIYVLDGLKRVSGVSDVSVFGRKYAMSHLARLRPHGRPVDDAHGGRHGDSVGKPPGRRR